MIDYVLFAEQQSLVTASIIESVIFTTIGIIFLGWLGVSFSWGLLVVIFFPTLIFLCSYVLPKRACLTKWNELTLETKCKILDDGYLQHLMANKDIAGLTVDETKFILNDLKCKIDDLDK